MPPLRSLFLLLSASALAACGTATFTRTDPTYVPKSHPLGSIKVATERPGNDFAEVGILTATGRSQQGKIDRIKDEAESKGCDIAWLHSNADPSAPGGVRNELRASCLVYTGPGATAVAADAAIPCAPACRRGFACLAGRCVSECNPPCDPGLACVGRGAEATCVAPGADAAR